MGNPTVKESQLIDSKTLQMKESPENHSLNIPHKTRQ